MVDNFAGTAVSLTVDSSAGTIISGLTIFLFCSMTLHKDNLLTGSWKATEIKNEMGGLCDNFTITTRFTLTVFKDNNYELFKQIDSNKWVEKGSCKIDNVEKELWFNNVKCRWNDSLTYDYGSHNYPIVVLSPDSLVIRYNFCCGKDTCNWTSGLVTFIKDK